MAKGTQVHPNVEMGSCAPEATHLDAYFAALDAALIAEEEARVAADLAVAAIAATEATPTTKGIVTLGAPGGARTHTATLQVLAANGVLAIDIEQLRVTAPCTVTLPAIATLTIGRTTQIVIESIADITVELVPHADDKIEGAARAALYAANGVYILTPTSANRWMLTAGRGVAQWTHATVNLAAAVGASPWPIGGVVVTDISTAGSSFTAAAGLVAAAKSSSTFTSGASADCALARTPLSGLVDGWARPLNATRDTFWILAQQSRTAGAGASNVLLGLGGAAVSNVPRIAGSNSTQNANFELVVRDSAARTLATAAPSTTASGWMGYLWEGPARRVGNLLCSTAPVGMPGAAAGWWPQNHATAQRYAAGQDFFGSIWDISALTDVQIGQSNQTSGPQYTFVTLALVRQIGVPG